MLDGGVIAPLSFLNQSTSGKPKSNLKLKVQEKEEINAIDKIIGLDINKNSENKI